MRNITFLKVTATKTDHKWLNPEHIYEAKENKNQPWQKYLNRTKCVNAPGKDNSGDSIGAANL